jgi:hypothetical protein
MGFEKPAASLTASLLARKGQARPAMRPGLMLTQPTQVIEPTHHPDRLLVAEDVEPEAPAPRPVAAIKVVATKPVKAEPELAPAEPTPVVVAPAPVVSAPRAAPGQRARSAFTLRLDSERHLRLRLLCAHRHKSAQHMLIEALDAWLASNPIAVADNGCPCRETNS